MKVSTFTFLTILVFFVSFFGIVITANAQNKKIGIQTVVIDAGHGGPDGGAVGRIYKEKEINLDVALQLGKMIQQNYPEVTVLYTRQTDVLIPLQERGAIANKANADLFISIHVNSNKSSTPSGSSTYVMGVDKTGKSLGVAMKENDVITYEKDYTTKYQGYTPGSAESFIIFSLMQFSFQKQSGMLADLVQKQFTKHTQLQNRGVYQDGFLVLWSAAMPSILTEFGFISNPTEERYIGSAKGREAYARCLFNAFSEYKVLSEGSGTSIVLNSEITPETDSTSQEEAPRTEIDPSEPIIYRVQIATSDSKLPKNSARFGPFRGEVIEIIIQNKYKYYYGGTSSYKEALSLQNKVRQNIKDAFLVPFVGDEPISMEQARRRQQ